MNRLHQFLRSQGRILLARRLTRVGAQILLAVALYYLIYFYMVILIQTMSMTRNGLLFGILPAIPVAIGFAVYWFRRFSNPRKTAAYIEEKVPEVGLSLRTGLDFMENRTDHGASHFTEAYLENLQRKLDTIYVPDEQRQPWGRHAFIAVVLLVGTWSFFGDRLTAKFYNPALSFGQTHLDLSEGNISIFEPEYTQIPGRTLPLKPGNFQAYPGSRVRFVIQLPNSGKKLFVSQNDEDPTPIRVDDTGRGTFEFLLTDTTKVQFLMDNDADGGRTSPYLFQTKTDSAPELLIRGHTPVGRINTLDPLYLQVEVKDDFGTSTLEAVITWSGGENRIPLQIPQESRKHFIKRNQWYLSDLGLEDAESFDIYLEAADNNPINGPGIGRSETLTYELESPDRKYKDFIKEAEELLDTMTHTLGDNLVSDLDGTLNQEKIAENEALGRNIHQGLEQSTDLTNLLLNKIRETPHLTRLDQNFFYKFRDGLLRGVRQRKNINFMLGAVAYDPPSPNIIQRLGTQHKEEELSLEKLTYELLLQLKLWAVLEMERRNNELEQSLDSMQELMDQSENMDSQELMEQFNKLFNEIMKDFQEMMQNAAQQMDMTMEEFMNQDAMENMQTEQMQDIREQIMEALKEGDMEKAKMLMEQMRSNMQQAMNAMQQQVGEMSPEMQEMMKQMREFMGLLRELKSGEEELERKTRELKREIDEKMGKLNQELDQRQQQEQKKILENIHKKLTGLYNKLVDYSADDVLRSLLQTIEKNQARMEEQNIPETERMRLELETKRLERTIEFIQRNGLEALQNQTLRSLEETEKMQEYLDQGELMLGLETGYKLDNTLSQGERLSDRSVSDQIREDIRPEETYQETRLELRQILDMLQSMRSQMENRRRQFMEQSGEKSQEELAQMQQKLQQMIQEFQERAGESLGESPLFQRLDGISRSMERAESRLEGMLMESALQNEQNALQQIGELMEQMQQSQQPNGRMPMGMMPMGMSRRQGFGGDPLIEDIPIPEGQRKADKDAVKDAVRKQLEKNLPDSYGKEIRKYYEKLIDQ